MLASDGVWGPLDCPGDSEVQWSEEVVLMVEAARAAGLSAGEAAAEVVREAESKGGDDNMSCLVLYL